MTMFNNPFVRAAGLVAICYIVLQALGWVLRSIAVISTSFSYWIRHTLIPHAWQIGLAIGVIYLVLTALTSSRNN
ncbi:MAG TPA: hypothetical protein V6C46_07455 [Coleofasciculaceae cyanobacterium]